MTRWQPQRFSDCETELRSGSEPIGFLWSLQPGFYALMLVLDGLLYSALEERWSDPI